MRKQESQVWTPQWRTWKLNYMEMASKGLVNRVQKLEGKAQPSNIDSPSASSSHHLSVDSAVALKECIAYLEKSNEVLMGISSKLQHQNKSLQNQLYVQKDRQNYLNLHFGGVSELEEKTPLEEVLHFCKEVLKLLHVTEQDIVKTYWKFGARDTEEKIENEEGEPETIQVHIPGVMFICPK